MDLGLAGKRALVTGGSRGIGRAITLALGQQGVAVAACYARESEAASGLAGELEALGNGSYAVRADVSDAAEVARLLDGVRERLGGIDVLVNNAGIVSHQPLAQLEPAEWQRVIDTNLTSMYLVTRAALDALSDGASIVNLTSAVALVGMPARSHYTASKAGVLGLTRSLCKELGARGIRVNGVAPGIIDTDQASGLNPEQRARYAAFAALGRLGEPDDVARVVLFLASDLSRFVSGVTINVDGGI